MSVEIKNDVENKSKHKDTAIESMSDILILRPNGKIAYLSYDFYTDKSRVIESVPVEGEITRFFLEDDGVYPFNLSGPTVTKVIDWNLYNSQNELRSAPDTLIQQPETGYFLDLRRISLNRLDMLKPSGVENMVIEEDNPVTHDLTLIQNGFHLVPDEHLEQLKQIPENDNLYIAFYQHPEKTRSVNQNYSYCISYISAGDLDECEYAYNSPVCKLYSEKDIKKTTVHLESYYGDTKVQSGALNPDDFQEPYVPANTACYIANLRTFKS